MNVEHVREFLEVTATRSISGAADNLMVSQSALSKHLTLLESELGVTLLERSRKGVALTADARELLPQFKRLLTAYDKVLLDARRLVAGRELALKVGFLCHGLQEDLDLLQQALDRAGAHVALAVKPLLPAEMMDDLLEWTVDVSFTFGHLFPLDTPGLVRLPIYRLPFVALVSKTSNLGASGAVETAELTGQRIVMVADDLRKNQQIRRELARVGVTAYDEVYTPSVHTYPITVATQNAVALVPQELTTLGWTGVQALPIANDALATTMELFYLEQNDNPAIKVLVEALKQA